jgi:hypothetical protein
MDNLELVNSHFWRLRPKYNYIYASIGNQKLIFHREIMLESLSGFGGISAEIKVVHIDGNNLNNRKQNLRIAPKRS